MHRLALPLLLSIAACSSEDVYSSFDASDASIPGSESSADDDVGGGDTDGRAVDLPTCTTGSDLTAAEWRDTAEWPFFASLLEGQFEQHLTRWGADVSERVAVEIMDGEAPVGGATVELRDTAGTVLWTAQTDRHGRAELLAVYDGEAPEGPLTLHATALDGTTTTADAVTGWQRNVLTLPDAADPEALDLMLVVDTTGSMGDELSYLQCTLADVLAQIEQDHPGVDLRVSVNFYRDQGDAYLVRSNPFTAQLDLALAQLAAESADGGGDFPEAIDHALEDAVQNHHWRRDATARLAFVVLDAPPHDDADAMARYHGAVREAAAQGVRLVPVGASGIDRATEALLRTTAVATGGTYTFLTDDSGIGNDHLEPVVGPHDIERLNNLMLRLVDEALGSWRQPADADPETEYMPEPDSVPQGDTGSMGTGLP
jgi:hypothetical protein